MSSSKLFEPLRFARGKEIANRFSLAPMTNLQSNGDGTVGEDELRWLTMRARGGFGMTMTCGAHVQAVGQGFPGQLGVWADKHISGLERLAKAIKAEGSVASLQLYHGGLRADPSLIGGAPVAPWDDEETGARALSTAEVEQAIEDFILAAVRADRAGFDGIELHGAHGYLLAQFLDAGNTKRTDRYGGSFENRTRVLKEVIDGIRARTNPQFQLGVRLSAERFGIALAEARALAQQILLGGKVDFLDMSLWDVFKEPAEEEYQQDKGKLLIDYFTDLERGNTRLGVAGKIRSAEEAQRCIDKGVDFVMIGLAAIVHHDFPRQVQRDAQFHMLKGHIGPDHLAKEGLGPAFIGYLGATENGLMLD